MLSIKRLGYQDAAIEYPTLPPSLKSNPAKGGELAKKAGLPVSSVVIDTSLQMGKITRDFGAKLGWLCLFEKDSDIALEKTKEFVPELLHPFACEWMRDREGVLQQFFPSGLRHCRPSRSDSTNAILWVFLKLWPSIGLIAPPPGTPHELSPAGGVF